MGKWLDEQFTRMSLFTWLMALAAAGFVLWAFWTSPFWGQK